MLSPDRCLRIGTLLAAFMALFVLPARAETIMVNSSSGSIYLVEVETRAVRRIASAPVFFDIAISLDGTVLGVTGQGALWHVTIDGPSRPVGRLGMFVNALGRDRDGALLAAGQSRLVRVRALDAQIAPVGDYPGFDSSGDLTRADDGWIYLTSRDLSADGDVLFRLDDGLKRMERIGPIGFRAVYGLVWSERLSTLIGVTEARELIEIDRETGAGRAMGVLDIDGWGYGAAALSGTTVMSLSPEDVSAR